MPRPADPRVSQLMATVALNLRRFRLTSQMTQEDAGQAIGSNGQQLAKWERGDSWINPAHLKLLGDLYQRPVDHFFMEKPPWIDAGVPRGDGKRPQ